MSEPSAPTALPQQDHPQQPSAPTDDFTDLDPEILALTNSQIRERMRLIEGETRLFRSEYNRLMEEKTEMLEKIQDTKKKIDLNTTHPHLVSNVVEILEVEPEEDGDGAAIDKEDQIKGKCA
ncbi:26S proteasome regulatory subunit 6A, partial [Spiromyces aspiralis]